MKIVMAVPFQEMTGNAGVINKSADKLIHAARQCRARISYTIAHCVAKPDFNINAAFISEFH